METNLVRRLNWLWKNRHTHDSDDETADTRQLIIQVINEEVPPSDTTAGAHIHLTRGATQSIGTTGAAVQWDTQSSISEASFTVPSLPSSDVTITLNGYYNVAVQAGFDVSVAGAACWVTRTRAGVEATVWPPTDDPGLWTASAASKLFEGTAHAIPCLSGDILRVYVDHSEASSQTLASAALAVYLVDHPTAGLLSYRSTVLEAGPVAYWRLDEAEGNTAASDETGNGHDGTYGGGVTQGADGLIVQDDAAASFSEASSDGVEVPIHTNLKFLDADFTIEAWVKVTADLTASRYIFCWTGAITAGAKARWGIAVDQSGSALRFTADRAAAQVATTAYDFSQNVAYHVAVTYDATTDDLLLYVDGVAEASGTSAGSISDSTNAIRIGRNQDTGVDGVIDEVAVYDTVLSAERLAHHAAVGKGQVIS